MSKLDVQAAPGVHETVLQLLAPSYNSRKKVLDLGAGSGALAESLRERGFEVTPCDAQVKSFMADSFQCDIVDLNEKLPYEDSSFDIVTCVEVIEHLENPWHLLREMHRVLKPEGEAVVTTPNISDLYSRFLFLLTGRPRWFPFKRNVEHINPISLLELQLIAENVRFKIKRITYNRGYLPIIKRGNWMYPSLPMRNKLFGEILILNLKKL